MKKILIGHAGVDSGQLMVCDPCYIDSEWERKEFADIRIYEHKKTKKKLMYQSSAGYGGHETEIREKAFKKAGGELFATYDTMTSFKKTMNEMEKSKEVKELPNPEKAALIGSFSYAGACETTMANKHQLKFKMGHAGAGVVFNSGVGDGIYPVYGTFAADGTCVKVEIDMGLTPAQKKFMLGQ